MPAAKLYSFAGLGAPLVVAAPAELEPLFAFYLAHWPRQEIPAPAAADIAIDAEGGGYRVRAERLGFAAGGFDAINAVNQLSAILVSLATRQGPRLFAAHASAVAIAGRALVLAGQTMSGKSTLALQLTRLGGRHMGDDQVLIDAQRPPQAVPLGLAARMRLPVHRDGGEAFSQFIAARLGQRSDNFAAIELRDGEFMPLGASQPVAAIVLPRIEPGAGARLMPASRLAAAQMLLEQGRAPHWSSQEWARAVGEIVAAVELMEIAFDNSLAAAELLWRRFQA